MAISPSKVRTGTRYRSNRLAAHYDVIVVGSGIGGLTTAACLAKLGKSVCVFEQHYTAGGMTHTYERNGYEWDVGVHYIGDMGSPNTIGRRCLDFIGDGSLKWAPMDHCFDRIFLGAQSYDLVSGKSAYINQLKTQFPSEHHTIDQYVALVRQAGEAMKQLSVGKLMPGWLFRAGRRFFSAPAQLNRTTRTVLEEITDNQTLIAVLTGQWGDCGLPPAESSFLMHAAIAHHYMYGGYYPVGGSSQIARSIIPGIEAAGGNVFTYASVEEIIVREGSVQGVRMADGHVVACDTVVSATGVINTIDKLISPTEVPSSLAQARSEVSRSMASICLYIGLDHTAEQLKLPKTNLWVYPSEDYESHVDAFRDDTDAEMPLIYISFPSAKDPDFERRYPGKATIEIVAPGLYETFAPWHDKPWGNRGEDYDALKAKLSERLLAVLYKHMPQVEGKIAYHELSTNLSTDYFCRYEEGEIYGLNHDPSRFTQSWLRPKTPIKGLYLSGQDILSCGVIGAMLAGALCAVKVGGIRGLKILRAIFSKTAASSTKTN